MAMVIFRSEWLSFALTRSFIHLLWYFKSFLVAGTFATQRKRANILPIRKKKNKQIVSKYRPVSLLHTYSKTFEKLIFNKLFRLFEDKNLLFKHQSDFCPGDSCINQLLAITHDVFSSFWLQSNSRDSRCVPWHIYSVCKNLARWIII